MATQSGAVRGGLCLLGLLLAALPAPSDPVSEREQAQTRLEDLSVQVAAGAQELGRLGGALRNLELEASTARVVEEGASRRVEAARQRIADAEARLAEVEAVLAEHDRALADRAVRLYTHGSLREVDVLQGLDDSEEFADRLPYLRALALSDAALVEDVQAVRDVRQAARDRLAELEADAREQEDLAHEAALTVEGLRAQQQQVVAAAEAEAEHRADLLFALEQDAAARQALVERLEAQTADLTSDLAGGGGPIGSEWIARLPPNGQAWGQSIIRAAGAAGIDPRLLAAVAWTESNFRPSVVSPAGAIGLVQLLPSTAEAMGVDPYEPEDNLVGGARYLAGLLDRYLGRVELAAAAYNAGPGEVDDAGGIPAFPETQLYVTRVLDHYEELRG